MIGRKRTFMLLGIAVVIGCLCLASNARAGASADAYEQNGSFSTAHAMTPGTYSCNFDTFSDVDYYNVTVATGEEIRVSASCSGNIIITLYGQAAAVLATSANATQANTSHIATYSGNHTIYMDGWGALYTMVISVGPPAPAAPGYDMAVIACITLVATAALCVMTKHARKIQF